MEHFNVLINLLYVFLYNTIKRPYQPKHSPSYCAFMRFSMLANLGLEPKCMSRAQLQKEIWSF